MQMKDSRGYGSASPANADERPTSSSDRHRKGNGAVSPARSPAHYRGRGTASRPGTHQGMQRRVPAERGISAYQHEHTTSQWNGATVRRPLRTVPLVPLEGASDTPQRKEGAQAVWSYVGDAEDIVPVAPTAPSFSTERDEVINEDGFIQPQPPLDHETTGVHHYGMGGRADGSYFVDRGEREARQAQGPHTPTQPPLVATRGGSGEWGGSDGNFPVSGATWPTYEEAEEESFPRYRRAYGSISPARPRRDPDTGETIHHQGMGQRMSSGEYAGGGERMSGGEYVGGGERMSGGGQPRPYSQPLARTDALVARTDALVGGYTGGLAAEARYHPTTTPLGSPYDRLLPMSALKRKRDTIFLMLLTLLVLSIIGIMSCNYLLSIYNA
jgi:hypothetical protein